MAGSIRLSPTDQSRKARFREEARLIVQKDRYDRGRGVTVDTAGAIARALDRAYRMGFDEATAGTSEEPEATGWVHWSMIGFRPRAAFYSLCLPMFGNAGLFPERASEEREGYLEHATTVRGTDGWRIVVDRLPHDFVFASRTIEPLVRLGLLDAVPDRPEHLHVTARGHATWMRFVNTGGRFPHDVPVP